MNRNVIKSSVNTLLIRQFHSKMGYKWYVPFPYTGNRTKTASVLHWLPSNDDWQTQFSMANPNCQHLSWVYARNIILLYHSRLNMLDIFGEDISFFVCIVLLTRFRDSGFYISEPANLCAAKIGEIVAQACPFISHLETHHRHVQVATPPKLSPKRFGTKCIRRLS